MRWTLWGNASVLKTAKRTFGESWFAPTLRCPSFLKMTHLSRYFLRWTCVISHTGEPRALVPQGAPWSWASFSGYLCFFMQYYFFQKKKKVVAFEDWVWTPSCRTGLKELWFQDVRLLFFLPVPQKSTLSHLLLGEHDIPLTCLEQVVTGTFCLITSKTPFMSNFQWKYCVKDLIQHMHVFKRLVWRVLQ